jgi:hypothetical protein
MRFHIPVSELEILKSFERGSEVMIAAMDPAVVDAATLVDGDFRMVVRRELMNAASYPGEPLGEHLARRSVLGPTRCRAHEAGERESEQEGNGFTSRHPPLLQGISMDFLGRTRKESVKL